MGLPELDIQFQALANTAVKRLSRGVVAVIVRDTKDNGACILTREAQIGTELKNLGASNQEYIRRTFAGNTNKPAVVIVYVLPDTAEDLSEALKYLTMHRIDYLVGPPDISLQEKTEIKQWIDDQRGLGATPKAVLPKSAADNVAIINFTTDDIFTGATAYTTEAYCSRIAGLIAGTPPTESCTSTVLPEVTHVKLADKAALDTAIDNGEFVIYNDRSSVKVGRGVNSFVNAQKDPAKNDSYKKIKIIEVRDMINDDIRSTIKDSYTGRYTNGYDSKCLLISAIANYLTVLEQQGLVRKGSSAVEIDMDATEKYLTDHGVDISEKTEQEIKEADTGSWVFLAIGIKILDAMEDFRIRIYE